MHSAARKLEARTVFQEFGELVAESSGGLRVRTALAEVVAQRAVSCLVAPRVGDRVLVAMEEDGDNFVLAVLARETSGTTTIAVEGDLDLRAPQGKVTIVAREGVDIAASAPVRITASAVDIAAVEGRLAFQLLDVFGAVVKAELGKVKALASTIDSVLERVSLRVKRSYRTVEEVDQVRAQQIDYVAKTTARLHGENTLITAEDLVKLNADQVHLG